LSPWTIADCGAGASMGEGLGNSFWPIREVDSARTVWHAFEERRHHSVAGKYRARQRYPEKGVDHTDSRLADLDSGTGVSEGAEGGQGSGQGCRSSYLDLLETVRAQLNPRARSPVRLARAGLFPSTRSLRDLHVLLTDSR